jgi:hypothetical protein
MAIVINGSGTVTGLAVGGLPDGTVDAGTLATNSVDSAELIDGAVDDSHIAALASSKLTGDLPAISGASLTSVNAVNTGRKNLIINGSMKVAQRGASFTDPASGAYTLDRWRAGVHTSTAAANYTQEADAPTAAQAGTNFVNCLKIDVTTADTSTAATVRYYTRYHVEGNDLARAGFGQSGVRYMTLSFWHKHTKTGINSFGLVSNDNGRHYVAEYTQTTSDTWEKATHTFPVDTTGTWLTDTGNGMTIYLVSHIGSNYQKSANAWAAGNGYGTANQVNNFDSTSNNMRFTGVQLEMGSVATDFEHRSYGEELALCQRYYQQNARVFGVWVSASNFRVDSIFTSTMRVSPSVTIINTSAYHEKWNQIAYTGISASHGGAYGSNRGFDVNLISTATSARSYGEPAILDSNALSFDAEL